MYKVTDVVMHPRAGVCTIEAVRPETFTGTTRMYYVMRPLYENTTTTIYVPTDSDKIKLRRLLSKDEILELIHSVSLDVSLWIDNPLQRKEHFLQLVREGDHATLIRLIVELHRHRLVSEKSGRKFHAADEKILKEAEACIHQEFAHALNLQVDEIAPFIMKELGLS